MTASHYLTVSFAFASLLSNALDAEHAGRLNQCKHGRANGYFTGARVAVASPSATVARTLDSLLPALRYGIDSATSVSGRWVSKMRFSWPNGTEQESWHGTEHPGLRIVVSAVTRGDSTEVSAAAQVMCILDAPDVDAKQESVSSKLKLMSVLEVISSLSKRVKEKAGQ